MAKDKLIPMSRLRESRQEMDTVAFEKQFGDRRAFDIILQAQVYWDKMDNFRKERERNKKYCYGDQWQDIVTDEDGCTMTEEEYIKKQGSVPLKNNLIRRLVRNVLGVYRSQAKEPICTARDRDEQRAGETMSSVLQYNWQMNRMTEINARTMEDFLIGGFIVHRKWYGWQNDRMDCWTTYVNPNNFFIDNRFRDFRGWDVSFLGEIHDISFPLLIQTFAKTEKDYERLRTIYAYARNRGFMDSYADRFGESSLKNLDFLLAQDVNMCRVIEVWRKETKPRYRCHDYLNGDVFKVETEDLQDLVIAVNEERMARGLAQGMAPEEVPVITYEWFIDEYWYYYFLSPFGDILDEGETPYDHKSHPYVFKAYPFIDSEIHSFVNDVIDQQRYTNRLITLYDWIMRASAKGVLIFPEECMSDQQDLDEVFDNWTRFNGVIIAKTKDTDKLPQQIANNSTNIGISELLNLQLKFFEDISGVNGALQGKPGYSSTSGTLYAQQTQNATTSLLDLLDSFSMFIIDGAYKDVKNIQQFYDDKRVFNITGKAGAVVEYDPNKVRDVEFDLSIVESTATPAYRDMANAFLMQIWQSGQIGLEQLLEHGDFPFADSLLQSIKSQQEQMAQGQSPQPLSPALMRQVQMGADMNAVNMAYNMLLRGNTGRPVLDNQPGM